MASFLANLFIFITMTILSWISMIYGWGISPKSWPTILWVAVGQIILLALSVSVSVENYYKK